MSKEQIGMIINVIYVVLVLLLIASLAANLLLHYTNRSLKHAKI